MPMRLQRVGMMLIALFFMGIIMVWYTLIRFEHKNYTQDVLNKGSYLVSLIALHPVRDIQLDTRKFFSRTLHEYIPPEGFMYLLIHDRSGNPLVVLDRNDVLSSIPENVEMKSLYTMGLTRQTFRIKGEDQPIYEFAKPIFEDGQRSGTVRLGLKPPHVSFFSLQHVSFMATVALFLFSMGIFIYYGIILALQRVKNINKELINIRGGGTHSAPHTEKKEHLTNVFNEVDQSLNFLKNALNNLEMDKLELEAKSGAITYEKKLITYILDSVRWGIIVTNLQNNISHINSYMLALLKKKREDVVDHPLSEVLDHQEILSFVSQEGGTKQGAAIKSMETTFPQSNSGEVFQVSSPPLKDSEGNVIGKIVSVKNITSDKLAEEAKHEFIATAAHELRAPLTTIKSYNEMLMGDEIEDIETKKEFYNTISEETDRLARLIENLLNISKMEMGSLSLNRGIVKTDSLVQDCIAAVEARAQKKGIKITIDLPDKFPSLVGDKELLKVALINILGNAVKYTPPKGTIAISLSEKDHHVVFDITDSGSGISREDLPRIFDKFYRSSDQHVSQQSGSGLGLAISLEIVHLHGGAIQVHSELEKGSHFSITIPKEEYYVGK